MFPQQELTLRRKTLWERPCVPTLWITCKISPIEWRNVTGGVNVETRALKRASETSNVSFCVFSKRSVWKCVSLIYCCLYISGTITFIWQATDSTLDSMFFSAHAKLCGCECMRSLCCLFAQSHVPALHSGSVVSRTLPEYLESEWCARAEGF